MEWFNMYGLLFMVVIMIPNILYAVKCKDGFENKYPHKALACLEQIGRYGCLVCMVFHIPGTWFGWWSENAFAWYLIINILLIGLYCTIWAVCWKKNTRFRALALSILPAVVFLFSGIMSQSVLLILSALLFAPSHILISYRNAI
jgi:hypothetical protein